MTDNDSDENENAGFSRRQKLMLVGIGFVLGATILGFSSALLSEPYTIGAGVTIDNPGGPTIHVEEEVHPQASNQSPEDNVIDLRPHAVFESNGTTEAHVSGWDDQFLVLKNLQVGSTMLNVTRGSNTVGVRGAADRLELRDYTTDSLDDFRVWVSGSATIRAEVPDSINTSEDTYAVLVDADNGTQIANTTDDYISTTISQDRNLRFEQRTVQFENPDPDGKVFNKSTNIELSVDLQHPELVNGDLFAEFRSPDGTLIENQTVQTAGEINTTWSNPPMGQNIWYVKVIGAENITRSQNFTFGTPHELEIRDEQTNALLNNLPADIEVRFFALGDSRVIERSTSNGIVDLSGLPTEYDLVVDANATGYHQRSTIIRDISRQQTAYLLNTSSTANSVAFEVTDRTGDYPSDTSRVLIRKPITNQSRTEYKTVVGDSFGANNRVSTTLEAGGRYRVLVENEDGDERSFGSYVANVPGDVVTLEIGEISIEPPEAGSFVFETREVQIQHNNETRDAIRVIYRDDSETTNYVEVDIHQRNNESLQIYGPERYYGDTVADTILIPKAHANISTWTVNYEIDRETDSEIRTGKEYVGGLDSLNAPVSSTLLQTLSIGAILLIAGLFGGRLSQIGGVVVVSVAWVLQVIGFLSLPIEFLIAAAVIALFFLVGSDRREVKA